MRKVFVAAHPAEAHMVKGLLESEGIEAIVRGEALFSARGLIAVTQDTLPSVWVLNPADAEEATRIIASPRSGTQSGAVRERSWRCPACNEFVGPEFAVCWNCSGADSEAPRARRA